MTAIVGVLQSSVVGWKAVVGQKGEFREMKSAQELDPQARNERLKYWSKLKALSPHT
jgi:hypothetical protein